MQREELTILKTLDKKKWLAFFNSDSLRAQVAKGTVGSFIIQGSFAVLSFITATFLARVLGSEAYGAFSNAIAWANILTVLGLFGFDSLVLRNMAIYRAQDDWKSAKGLLRFSDRLVLGLSVLLICVVMAMAGILFSSPHQYELKMTLWISAPLIPLWTFAYLRISTMRGLQYVVRAMLPEYIIRPALTLIGIVGLYLVLPRLINPQLSMVVSVASSVISLSLAMLWLRRFLPNDYRQAEPRYQVKEWLRVAFPMFLIGGTQILITQSTIVILGLLSTSDNVGYFSAVSRLANLMIFLPLAVGIVMGPIIARLYSQGDKIRLQTILRQASRIAFVFTLLIGSIFLVFGKKILGIFGSEYIVAYKALNMLVIGYLVDTGLGISIITLTMTGFEKIVARYQIASAVLLIILCTLLTPSMGSDGAALGFMITMILSRIVYAITVIKKTSLNTTIV
jgi:O-antigen/teichoic acid export membrane protein